MEKKLICPHCEEEITPDDMTRALEARLSAASRFNAEQLDKIYNSMYTFSKNKLGFTDEEAKISAQNSVDSLSGK